MSEEPYAQELQVALEAVREASRLCQTVQAQISPDVLEKKDRSPVTVADFGSQALVCRRLAAAFPADPVIGEEDADELRSDDNAELRGKVLARVRALHPSAGEKEVLGWIDHGGAQEYSPRFWTLDPIDGTKGFLRGEQYAVALALIVDGEPAVAAMACPNLETAPGSGEHGVAFTAVRGAGARAVPLSAGGAGSPVAVNGIDRGADARFCESVESGHTSQGDSASVARELGIRAEPVRLDSQAKYAVVARGEASAYLRLPTRPGYVEKIWDHAAGALVVTEAGGKVTDIHGRPLEFRHGQRLERNRGVIVTNGRLHDEVLGALQTVGVV